MLNPHCLGKATGFQEECQQLLDQCVSYYREADAAGYASVYSHEAEVLALWATSHWTLSHRGGTKRMG